jgi:outer membrane protein OmpA-like peptidoglycan-associated protein
MRVWVLAAAVLIAGNASASAQWTEACVGPGNKSHDGRVCECPAGSKKVRWSAGDLSDFQNKKGIRRYNCVQVAQPIESYIIFFNFGAEEFSPEVDSLINTIVERAKQDNATKIELIGHTDTALVPSLSKTISLARAEAVKAALVAKGMPASAISTRGEGKSKPLVPTPDGVKEPQNRRVEILLYK